MWLHSWIFLIQSRCVCCIIWLDQQGTLSSCVPSSLQHVLYPRSVYTYMMFPYCVQIHSTQHFVKNNTMWKVKNCVCRISTTFGFILKHLWICPCCHGYSIMACCEMVLTGCVPVLLVFHIQCAADSAVLLSVPAHQQYRQAGPHALHPGLLSAASWVAPCHSARQRRPNGHRQCNVSVSTTDILNS